MQKEATAFSAYATSESSVLVVDGYGIRLCVRRGQLIVSDGLGRDRRESAFSRATTRFRRLVLLGHSGFVTLDAMRWLSDLGVALVQIDRDGRLVFASGRAELNEPRLRRAQALAATSEVGLDIVRGILTRKLRGQASMADRIGATKDVTTAIDRASRAIDTANSLDRLRLAEANGAAAYWSAWEALEVRFARRDMPKVPAHWRAFGARSSLLTRKPRLASNPANAMLNYLYAVLEAETRIACLAVGLDPGLGILHADQQARDSLALDVMEAARPEADAQLLKLLSARVFRANDFHETRDGVCRVLPPLTHELAAGASGFKATIAPVAEATARTLFGERTSGRRLPTVLTQDNRSAAQDWKRLAPRRVPERLPKSAPRACLTCGLVLSARNRSYCDECLPERRDEHLRGLMETGPAAVARLRAEGRDPLKTPVVKRKIGQANRKRQREIIAWERENGPGPEPAEFQGDIWPLLQSIPLRRLAAATGLSVNYISLIRRGTHVPHPMHWQAFRDVAAGVHQTTP